MSWHAYINKKEDIKEEIRSIMFSEMLRFAQVHGVNAFSGKKIQLAFSVIEKIARLVKYDTIKCEDGNSYQECYIKAKLDFDFNIIADTYWPEGLYDSEIKEIITNKIIYVKVEAKTEDIDDPKYNKLIRVTFSKTTEWQNQHPEWDYYWPT